ncbi:hypothetical protein AWI32_11040 [Enterobacter bugandensis]|nr:hypothetical protein AWI32_11040 [Enterobacter bugandensis]
MFIVNKALMGVETISLIDEILIRLADITPVASLKGNSRRDNVVVFFHYLIDVGFCYDPVAQIIDGCCVITSP